MFSMAGKGENDRAERGAKSQNDDAVNWFGLVGIGFEFVAAICLCGAVGFWADRHWNTFPWLMIAGGVVGFASGLTMIVRAGHKAFKD
jgi:F0F1-type ATP synthase assembly protein I